MTTTTFISARRRALLGVVAVATVLGSGATTAPAQAADAQRVRFMTVNVDFGLTPAQVKQDFANYSKYADVVMFQEARDVTLRNVIDTSTWIVRQDTTSGPTRGSALAVRRSAVRATSPVTNFRLVKGTDGAACPGGGIQTRYIALADVHFRNGATVVAGSVHMPPGRCATGPGSPYAVMADNVVALSNRHPQRLLLGGDWNKTVNDDPNDISGRTGGRIVPRGIKIDGFYKPRGLANEPLVAGPDIHSPHHPVRMAVTLPADF